MAKWWSMMVDDGYSTRNLVLIVADGPILNDLYWWWMVVGQPRLFVVHLHDIGMGPYRNPNRHKDINHDEELFGKRKRYRAGMVG